MFAVIETGGKQYKVSPGDTLKIEKLDAEEGAPFSFEKVLLVGEGEDVKVGAPYIEKARVEAKVKSQGRGRRKIVFRYHPKTRYSKKKSHRQLYTEVEIVKIS